ncbi:MAG: 30S ribosomal protein S5, partial [Oxalobacteraceae bacterium]
IGSNNPHNVVKATIDGLRQLRSVEETFRRRGVDADENRG